MIYADEEHLARVAAAAYSFTYRFARWEAWGQGMSNSSYNRDELEKALRILAGAVRNPDNGKSH